MSEEIKEKLDLNPNNMNEIAKEAYYQLENYIFTLEKIQNNWNELKKWLEEEYKYVPTYYCRMIEIIFNKMQKMEGNNDN